MLSVFAFVIMLIPLKYTMHAWAHLSFNSSNFRLLMSSAALDKSSLMNILVPFKFGADLKLFTLSSELHEYWSGVSAIFPYDDRGTRASLPH